jgi:transglutaminase-like putative cysteine protease/uncharacterized protein (DUF58 family)
MSGRKRLPRLTPAAWRLVLVAVGLLGAAVNTGNNLIYLVFGLLMAALPVSAVLGWLNLRRVETRLKLPRAARVGSPFGIDVEIVPARTWPAARSVAIGLRVGRHMLGPALVECVPAGRVVCARLTARGERRGAIRVSELRLGSTFPFGFLRFERYLERADEVLVLPSTRYSAAPGNLDSREAGGRALSARVAGTEYAGLRRGSDEDDVRRVDWKVTARRGMTIVRETVGESRRDLRLEVSTRGTGEPGAARRRFEKRVSRLASRGRQALQAGGVVHLSVDASSDETYSGRGALLRLFRRLARLEPVAEDGTPLPPLPVEAEAAPVEPADPRFSPPGRAHRASTCAALAVGALALFFGDGIGIPVVLLLLVSMFLALRFKGLVAAERSLGSRLWKVGSVIALGWYVLDMLALRRDPLAASLLLTVFITLYAIFNARRAIDDHRLLTVSLLYIVLASALTTEVALALPLLLWLLATIHGLMAWTAFEPGARTWIDPDAGRLRYAVPALAACAGVALTGLVLFAIVPHFGTGAFRPGMFRSRAVTGFSDTTRLGDIGRIKLDGSKVMEIDLAGDVPPEAELRWRGMVLNEFDGRTWTRGPGNYYRHRPDENGRFVLDRRDDPSSDETPRLDQEIRLEPGAAGALFSASRAQLVVSRDFRVLGEDDFGNLELGARPTRRLSYRVASKVPRRDPELLRRAGDDDPPQVRDLNLDLPPLDRRIPALARRITAGTSTRYDRAEAIESWLSGQLTYSLDVRDRGAADPLSGFLFEGVAGHCEYFATAMVVLAREAGIPARFVAGYLAGERGRFGRRYIVRQSDAHSWVEVHFPGIGWVPFEPTPPAGTSLAASGGVWGMASYLHSTVTRLWDDYVVGIDLDDQARGLLALSDFVEGLSDRVRGVVRGPVSWHPLRFGVLGAVLVALTWGARRVRRIGWGSGRRAARGSSYSAMPAFYSNALRMLAGHGLTRREGETPAELAVRARQVLTERAADRLGELTRLYYRVRFDGVTRERNVSAIARALLQDVKS